MTDIRTEVPDGEETIRTQIIDAVKTTLSSAPFDPNGDLAIKLFDTVKKGNIEDITTLECPGCAVEEGVEEVFQQMYPVTDKTLRLYFHMKVIATKGVDPDPLINYYFGRVVRLFVTDDRIANLTLGVEEVGNSIERNGENDPEPGGTLILDIQYRHQHGDMFTE